jgi:type VI secretion system protein ImpM
MPEQPLRPGLCGKLPASREFVARDLPPSFVDPWDAWLDRSLAAARETLAERFEQLWLEAPAWSFLLDGGVCGPAPVAGVLLPSVDRVGRYFPLTLAAVLEARIAPLRFPEQAHAWLEALTAIGIRALEESLEVEALASALATLGPPPFARSSCLRAPIRLAAGAELGALAHDLARPSVLFTTDGAPAVMASLILADSLPVPVMFSAFLDGSFAAHGFEDRG